MISERLAKYFNGLRGQPQAQPWMDAEEVDAVMRSRRWEPIGGYDDMEIQVQVKDEQEAYLVQTGLQDDALRTFIKVCAALKQMTDDSTDQHLRKQVLHAVCCLYGCDK